MTTLENAASIFPVDLAVYNELGWFSIIIWYILPNISYQDLNTYLFLFKHMQKYLVSGKIQ